MISIEEIEKESLSIREAEVKLPSIKNKDLRYLAESKINMRKRQLSLRINLCKIGSDIAPEALIK
jgi:hypothetical protein